MGNGSRIRFWEDVWCTEVAFCNRFPDLYRISRAKNSSIAGLWVPLLESTHYVWDLQLRRNLHDKELDGFANLTTLLDSVHLSEHRADSRIWLSDNSGGFSCKSAFSALQHEDGFLEFRFYKFIWKSCVPIRVKFFAWSLSLEKINTSDVLQHKRPFQCLSPNRCVMCKLDSESIHHLFFQCHFARSLWVKVFNEFGLHFEMLHNLLHLLQQGTKKRWKKSIETLWICAVWAVTWATWKERNSRIFTEKYVSIFNLWDKILFWVGIWVKTLSVFKNISLTDLSMGWKFLL